MVSRKKAQGKARRKAAATAKSKEEEEKEGSSAATAQQQGKGFLDLQTQRLLIDNSVRRDSDVCRHGYTPFPEGHVCRDVVQLYLDEYNCRCRGTEGPLPLKAMLTALSATEMMYPDVMKDSAKIEEILTYFSFRGAHYILKGQDDSARVNAAITYL